MVILTAPAAGRFAQAHGSRAPMTYGLLLAGGGLLYLGAAVQVDTPYWALLPAFVVLGHGMGATMAPMTAAVMSAVGPQRAGLGSAMTNTSREVGGVFGIALLGTILTTTLRGSLASALAGLGLTAPQQAEIAAAAGHGTLDPSLLASLTPDRALRVQEAFGRSFMDGFHLALLVAGGVLLAAAVVANRFIPGRARAPGRPEAAVEGAPARPETEGAVV
jgi:MFS family permease